VGAERRSSKNPGADSSGGVLCKRGVAETHGVPEGTMTMVIMRWMYPPRSSESEVCMRRLSVLLCPNEIRAALIELIGKQRGACSPYWGNAQLTPSHFLREDLDLVDDANEEAGDFDRVNPWEVCLLEGRRTKPNSWYISWASRGDAAGDGMKRLKDGEADDAVGKTEYDMVGEMRREATNQSAFGVLRRVRVENRMG